MLEVFKNGFAMLLSARGRFAGFARAYARTKEEKLKALGLRIPKGTEVAADVLRGATQAQRNVKRQDG